MKSETESCRHSLAKFCTGAGLDIGFGGDPIVPWAICVDKEPPHPTNNNPHPEPAHIICDAAQLSMFEDNSLDFVYSSHCLEDFEDTQAVLSEWLRVLRPGGRLVLFLPDQHAYEEHCRLHRTIPNPAHKHKDFSIDYVKALLFFMGNNKVIHEAWPVPYNPYSFELVAEKTGQSS